MLITEGFIRIDVNAFGDYLSRDIYNGYITWGLFGFTMLENSQRKYEKLCMSQDIHSTYLHDIIYTTGGRTFWEDNGFEWSGQFDLSEESINRQLLNSYLERKELL
jgi:hypothetical protein